MKKLEQIFEWLIIAYDKNNKVKGAFLIKDRTENEANKEALSWPAIKNSNDWTMVKTEDEVKRFIKEFGMSQTAVKKLEGFNGDSGAVAEMAINFGYVWVDTFKKWINKNNSNYDERDEVVLNYIRDKYC